MTAVFAISVVFDYRSPKRRQTPPSISPADAVLDISSHIQAGSDELSLELSSKQKPCCAPIPATRSTLVVRDGTGISWPATATSLSRRQAPDQPSIPRSQFRGGWTRAAVPKSIRLPEPSRLLWRKP